MKRLLRNKANFEVLEGFLSELLPEDIKIEEILESEGNQKYENDKFNRVDILVKNDKNDLILIEVQNDSQSDYFHRMNYGQAKLLTEHLRLKQKYGEIKKIYSVNIVYFDLGQGDDYVYVGKTEFKGIHKGDTLQLSKTQKKKYGISEISDVYTTYYVVKVNKFNDFAKNTLDEWVYFLKHNEIKEEFRAKGLQKAKEILRINNLSDSEKQEFENYIKDWRIRESEIETALEKGIDKAKKKLLPIIEKKEQQLINSIKMMKQLGASTEQIQKATGLSKSEIDKIK
jgi:predicted transposase/invertase (TIGR01784 family)